MMEIISRYPVQAIGGALITGYIASIVSLIFLVMNGYLMNLHYAHTSISNSGLINILISATCIILWGAISDRVNSRLMLGISVILFTAVAPKIYSMIIAHEGSLLINVLILGIFFSIAWGTIPKTLSEIFPTAVRYSGVAFSYNLGFAIFGGLAPVTVTYILHKTNSNFAPVWYLWFVSALCIIGLCMIFFSNKRLGIHDHIAHQTRSKE